LHSDGYIVQILNNLVEINFKFMPQVAALISTQAIFVQPDILPQRLMGAYTVVNDLAKQYGIIATF